MLSRQSLQFKLVLLCLFLNGLMMAVGGAGFYGLKRSGSAFGHVSSSNLPSTADLGVMLAEFREIRIGLRTLGLPGISEDLVGSTIEGVLSSIASYKDAEKRYKSREPAPGEAALYADVAKAWSDFEAVGQRVLALEKSNDPTTRAKMQQIFLQDCPQAASAYNTAIDKLIEFQSEEAAKWTSVAASTEHDMILLVLSLIGIGSIAGLTLGLLFARSLTKSIGQVAEQLGKGAHEVASASSDISIASQSLSAAANEQAAALQETVSAIDEVSAMVSKNADNADRSQSSAQASRDAAVRGKTAVDDMIRSIDAISESNGEIMRQIENSNREISDIVKVIAEIGSKTKVINDIVFQTKLLSFNASVEAARAGEHGKGFAVVAEEVGNLAQMSGNAAKEISQMLEGSIQKVEMIVENTKTRVERLVFTGREKVTAGTLIARRCGEVLDEIVENASEVTQMVNEIATASKEQAQGVHEITKAMAQMDQVTQQNSAASQQTASASSQLSSQADALRSVVGVLRASVDGQAAIEQTQIESPRKVVQFKARSTPAAPPVRLRKVAGGETVPDETDSRFEEF